MSVAVPLHNVPYWLPMISPVLTGGLLGLLWWQEGESELFLFMAVVIVASAIVGTVVLWIISASFHGSLVITENSLQVVTRAFSGPEMSLKPFSQATLKQGFWGDALLLSPHDGGQQVPVGYTYYGWSLEERSQLRSALQKAGLHWQE